MNQTFSRTYPYSCKILRDVPIVIFYDVQPDAAAFIQQTMIFIDRPMMDTHHIACTLMSIAYSTMHMGYGRLFKRRCGTFFPSRFRSVQCALLTQIFARN